MVSDDTTVVTILHGCRKDEKTYHIFTDAETQGDSKSDAHAISAVKELLAACKHGAMSCHHPACTHGKRGDGNTCECHVKKCQDAIAKAEPNS